MNGLADTSYFIAEEQRRPRLGGVPDQLGLSVVTLAELRLGVLNADSVDTRERRLATLGRARDMFEWVAIDADIADEWARLTDSLRRRNRRAPVNVVWIAATALRLGLPVVTQDRDYDAFEEVDVIRV